MKISVIPANAGIQLGGKIWIPAFAGMTAVALILAAPATAQEMGHQDHEGMDTSGNAPSQPPPPAPPAQEHGGHGHDKHEASEPLDDIWVDCMPSDFQCLDQMRGRGVSGSGTSRLPGKEGGMHGLHVMAGDWMLMAHGYAQANYTDHKGPRGDDKFYVTSMAMLSAEKDFGGARLALRSMLSLEPAMRHDGYPNLFATGEVAYGQPLVDRQHPHDLFMELAAKLDIDVAPGTSLFLYGGPVGEPALGPSAFMHRGSAANNPEPPITHHWFDSTHITYGVVTAGASARRWQIEASAFRGREPDERRWDIETPKLDSWSIRATWNPTPKWAAQISHGLLKEPEALHGGENEHRTTASVHYADGRLSAMAAFSAKNRIPGTTLTAWLAEADYALSQRHSIFGRIENVKNDELFPDHNDPLHDRPFRITKLQAGYAWNTPLGDSPLRLTLGGSANAYLKPDALDAAYGRSPWGYTVFTRISLGN